MHVEFTKLFSKQLDSVRNYAILTKLSKTVEEVIAAKTVRNISNLKKLKGHDFAYRIKTGDYRIGLFIENDNVIFAYFGHRKDIYNKFP